MTAPRQILHIVRKDAQHLRQEIITSLVLLGAFAWAAPAGWTGTPGGIEHQAPVLVAAALHLLLPTAWLVLVSRLVHDEPLVGDRQFWLTRPYTWYSLLAAKVVFLAGFVWLPFLLMQAYLIHHAGLSLGDALPRLLLNVGALALVFFLPFLALASVTASIGRMMVFLLGGFVYVVLLIVGSSSLHGMRAFPPYVPTFALWLAAALLAGVVVFQYRMRETDRAQAMLAGIPVVACLVLLLAPGGLLFRHAFPESGSAAQLSFNGDPDHEQAGTGAPFVLKGNVFLLLPVTVSGVPRDVQMEGRGIQMQLDGPDGFRWASDWQVFPGSVANGPARFGVVMPEKVLAKIGGTPMSMKLTMAVEELRLGSPDVVVSQQDGYKAPEHGMCSFLPEQFMQPICRYPVHGPELTLVSAPVIQAPCGLDSPATAATPGNLGQSGIAAQGGLPVAFDPVFTAALRFYVAGQNPAMPQPNSLCPGTAVSFSSYKKAGEMRIGVTASGVKMGNYARHTGPRTVGFGERPE